MQSNRQQSHSRRNRFCQVSRRHRGDHSGAAVYFPEPEFSTSSAIEWLNLQRHTRVRGSVMNIDSIVQKAHMLSTKPSRSRLLVRIAIIFFFFGALGCPVMSPTAQDI